MKGIAEPINEIWCWYCKGKGKVPYESDGPGSTVCWAKCKRCNGTGWKKVEIKY